MRVLLLVPLITASRTLTSKCLQTGASMFSLRFAPVLLIADFVFGALPVIAQMENQLRINQIQVIGTHNSYHAGFAPSAAKLWQANSPTGFMGLDYQHQPLPQQLDSGVRQIELDIYSDSKGGLYAHPLGEQSIAA